MWKCWDYNPAALSVCLSAPCSGRESHSQMNRRRRWNIFRLSIQLIKGPKTLFDSHPIISRSDRICICTKNRCRLALWSTDANFGGLNNCWAVWDSKAATIICTYRMLSLNNGPAALRARFASFSTLKYRSVGRPMEYLQRTRFCSNASMPPQQCMYAMCRSGKADAV